MGKAGQMARATRTKRTGMGLLSVGVFVAVAAACTPPPAGPPPAPATTTTAPQQATTTTAAPGGGSHGGSHDCAGMSYTPLGAIPPQTPMFCMPLTDAPTTFTQGANSWVDDFEHGASMAALGAGYRTYEGIDEVARSATFRHNNHWMVDVEPESDGSTRGGSYLRPDRSFRFEDGKLVVEVEVAAGITDYMDHVAWPEIVISTADHPTDVDRGRNKVADEGYAYGHFQNADTIGVRLQPTQVPIEALFNRGNTRTWEMSFFQTEGARVQGGAPEQVPGVWRVCTDTDPDTNCRDKFRFELTKDSVTLYVNDQLYMRHTGLPAANQLPASFMNSPVYVYLASWTVNPERVVRFHWDRIAVNP